jgi:hypothetical protein
MAVKYIKCPYNRPNVHKTYQHLPLQDPPKFTQIANFGLKIYHLATLVAAVAAFSRIRTCWNEIFGGKISAWGRQG